MSYANNKGADQPVHLRSLISTFVVCCLDSIIPLVSVFEISRLYFASVAAQAGLCLTWSQTLNTGFLVTRLKLQHLLFSSRPSLFPVSSISYLGYVQPFIHTHSGKVSLKAGQIGISINRGSNTGSK